MGNAFIKESTLTDIANAIRTKTGETDLLLPSQMADAILSIGNVQTVSWADGTDEQIAADADITLSARESCTNCSTTC